MPGHDTFVEQRRRALFDEQRPRLLGIAYRMLGTVADAEDVLAEARRRWSTTELAGVEDPQPILIALVARLSLDRLRLEFHRRKEYAGRWLPEPVTGVVPAGEPSYSIAMLTALEMLSPLERCAYVLRVVCRQTYAEVAAALNRNEPAVRQVARRARRRLTDIGVPAPADPVRQEAVVRRFLAACRSPQPALLLDVMSRDVTLLGDGVGGTAMRQASSGREAAGRSLLALLRRLPRGAILHVEEFNGAAGIVVRAVGEPVCALAVQPEGDRVGSVYVLANHRKLAALRVPAGSGWNREVPLADGRPRAP
jgi:RNA polymerase sigma-70 factor, ECF subfamily